MISSPISFYICKDFVSWFKDTLKAFDDFRNRQQNV